jgi:glycosyltransferase involved in cell wall biosynthesis
VALRLFIIAPSAMFTDHLPHGDGLVAFGFVKELARRGHELHVATRRVALEGDPPPNVHVYRLGSANQSAQIGRLRFMLGVRRLYERLARSRRFDLAHQLNPVDVGVSLALAGEETPLVLGPYIPDWAASGPGADGSVGPLALRAKRLLRVAQQRRATTLLVSTPAALSKLDPGFSLQAHVHELPHGIDDQLWQPSGPPAGQTVLFLANLEVRKGIHVLLDAFEAVAARLPDARLQIAGDGPERQAVEGRVREPWARGRVELLGRVDRDRALALMQSCDVYCLPSYGEPFGMTALEAMACARPVVATAAGGLWHLVPDAGGRKVAPGDSAALADALVQVLGDPELRMAMGSCNRRIVEERFAWSRVGDRLEALYGEAIQRARQAGLPERAGGSHRPAPGRR